MNVADGARGPRSSLGEMLAKYRPGTLAEEIGVSRVTLHTWITGRASPKAEHIVRLSTFLGIDVGELTRIVANDSARRSGRVISDSGVA